MRLLGALSITADKSTYLPGDIPTFTITGGEPGSDLMWSSYYNGQPWAGEWGVAYGHRLDGAGAYTARAGNGWAASQLGSWKKEITAYAPDGSTETASVTVNVAAPTPVSGPPVQSGGSGFDDFFSENKTLLLVGAAAAVVFFMSKKK